MNRKKVNLRAVVLGLILLLGTSSAFATGKIRISNYLDTDLSIVSIFNPSESTLKMKIYDVDGNLYYTKKVSSETTDQKLFDFSYLEDGMYKIVLTGGEKDIVKEFEIEDNKLVSAKANSYAERTLIRSFENDLFVTYLSFENKSFNLLITDKEGNEVFEESYTTKPNFSKKFNVSALPKGDYNVRLISNNKEYNYAFRK